MKQHIPLSPTGLNPPSFITNVLLLADVSYTLGGLEYAFKVDLGVLL